MNKEERLELENELLMTCSKAQAINKYIDELEENVILTNQWYKSQKENKQLNKIIEEIKEDIENAINEAINNKINLEINTNNRGRYDAYVYVLDRIEELERSDSNE